MFFFCVPFGTVKNALIFFNSTFSDRKVNLVGTLDGSNVKYSQYSFQKRREKRNANQGKTEIFSQN